MTDDPPKSQPSRATFAPAQVIFREGEAGDRAYLVEQGLVEIRKKDSKGERLLGQIKPGEFFGEMALIDDNPRMASAVAAQHTICLTVARDVFKERMKKADPLLVALLKMFTSNIRELEDRLNRW